MKVMRSIIAVLALLALSCAWLGLCGRWHGGLDIFANFYGQYLLLSVVVVVIFTVYKMRLCLLFAVATLLLNCVQIGRFSLGVDKSVRENFSLHVLSFNVLCNNQKKSEVLDFLQHCEADVIVLSEIDADWGKALMPLTTKYPQYKISSSEDNFGLAAFSRRPTERMEIQHIGDEYLPVVNIELVHQETKLSILGIHPPPPISPSLNKRRNQQLSAVADYAATISHPIIVVGDMNATPWCHGMNLLRAKNLDFRTNASPCFPTWNARNIFALPIDHALCSEQLAIKNRVIAEPHGSDHRPVHFYFGRRP